MPLPLAEVLQLSLLWRWSAGKQHQSCEGPPPSQCRDEINSGVITPMQVFKHEQKRSLCGNRLQRISNLGLDPDRYTPDS